MDRQPFSKRSAFGDHENAFTRALAQARRAPLLDLSSGNASAVGLPRDQDAIADALSAAAREPYAPEALGLRSAREAIAERLGLDASRMLLTASTSEAYAQILTLLTDPGDAILVPAPSYPLFSALAQLAGVRAVPYALRYDGCWQIDPASLREAASAGARAVFFVSPNNPTGSFLRRDDFRLLRELGVPIVLDEVFAPYAFSLPAGAVVSPLDLREGLVFCLDGLSKRAAMPGMKLAWVSLAGADEAVQSALSRLTMIADTFLSASNPVQRAAGALLDASRITTDAIRLRTRRNLEALCAAFDERSAARPLEPEGGWYACLRVPALYEADVCCDEAWSLRLLERGVVVQPGYFFDFERGVFLVLSLLTPEPDFERGLSVLQSCLADEG
ncbi:MAG: pyridoxal phosphate-dependent aminotransferase [Deltaproteobacteria bacterium]|nr:pyridoxal phosphate-dependent aminotransferase [Deltaproteobacteria bacterium]